MAAKRNPKPEPVVVSTVCSLCGEDWTMHGEEPTTLDCIRLLKAKHVWPVQWSYTANDCTSSSTVSYLTPRQSDAA